MGIILMLVTDKILRLDCVSWVPRAKIYAGERPTRPHSPVCQTPTPSGIEGTEPSSHCVLHLPLLQVRTTPDAATANRPLFRKAIGDMLRFQLSGSGGDEAADVERLLVGGQALAELVPWAGEPMGLPALLFAMLALNIRLMIISHALPPRFS